MAGESENYATADSLDDNVKYGFERSEMYQSKLAGTVDPPFQRHLFLCYKSHDSWPSRVEDSESDPLPKLLASALKARRTDIKIRTRLTICEGGDDVKLSDGDVLIFPDMILYRGLGNVDVDSFVEDVLVNGKPWHSGELEQLSGSYVFVCAHNNRDRRCGVCGPPLIEKFKEEIESKNLKDQVFVIACSHIGGHKYAGNVIIFSLDSDGKIINGKQVEIKRTILRGAHTKDFKTKIFVGGIPTTIGEDEFRDFFSDLGEVNSELPIIRSVMETPTPPHQTRPQSQNFVPPPSSSAARLWKPAAQRNLRNQWSKLNSLRRDWRSAASSGRSNATAVANAYLSQMCMDGMDFGVLSNMPNIRMKASHKLLKQQELYRGWSSHSNEDGSDSGDCGGIPAFSLHSIASFEELAGEIASMFISELNLKRLLVVEFLSMYDEEVAKTMGLDWSDEIYEGEFSDLASLNLFSEETHEPILPSLRNCNSSTSTLQFKRQHDSNVIQVYITTWLAEVNIDKCRVDEIFAIVGAEMHVDFLESPG